MNDSLANVHPDAKIGENVSIAPFVTIEKDVVIGDNTVIEPNAVLMNGARIGKNCHIFPGAVIAGIPQDLKFKGEITTAEIGDNTTIREYVTVNRGTNAKGKTLIGSNCLIMSYVHVAHDCIIGNYCIMGSYAGTAGEVEMEDFAILSPGSLVHQFVRLGKNVMIQGGSKVSKDIPPYVLVGREPLRYMGLNSIGLRRKGFSQEQIEQIHNIYRVIYSKGRNTTQALEYIQDNFESSPEQVEIINFIRDSKRGIVSGTIDEAGNAVE
ncbi:MAG: acyl-ACP--UDP-N-acetylglucosamine O-acyltransferase [Bacteroidales bacterium]